VAYDVPGNTDNASETLKAEWNKEITKEFDRQLGPDGFPDAARFLKRHPEDVQGAGPPSNAVHWPGAPAEPRFCIDVSWAAKLADWGVRGRHSFHNEYCEYGLVFRSDAPGRIRPKRFIATTELPEYWVTAATHEPDFVRQMVKDVLGVAPDFTELYGAEGSDPSKLSPARRRVLFATNVAGNLNNRELMDAGVPRDPVGALNTKNVLFMSHPINGLDDLIYVVTFGARPYAVKEGGSWRRARLHEIFRSQGTTHLACRNADPGAAQGAYDQVARSIHPTTGKVRGSEIAFANPLGMYINAFATGDFTFNDNPLPTAWIKRTRGKNGLFQRLEFGPSDAEPQFLGDIMVQEVAGEPEPLTSGYLVAKRIEVGPNVVIGTETEFTTDLVEIPAVPESLDCSMADVCAFVRREKVAYEAEHAGIPFRGRL
jgi:hypothetical protein